MSDVLRTALSDVPDEPHVGDAVLARFLDGTLTGAERDAVAQHLGRCPICSEDLAFAARIEIEAEALDEVTRPRTTTRAMAPVRARESSGRTWLRLAAGIALVFGALLLSREAGRIVAGRLEPVLVAQLQKWTARDVSAEGTSFTLLGGPAIELAGVQIADDPRFSDAKFAAVSRVALHVDPTTLLSGRLEGSIELERPTVRLVRNRGGQWNIETLGGGAPGTRGATGGVSAEIERALDEAARGVSPAGAADAPRVQLTSATIEDGVLEIEDLNGNGRPLRLENVDLAYLGNPGQRASLSVEGQLGSANDRIALRGEIGPFQGDVVPVYRLREVEIEALPVSEIPGAPGSVIGQLTFDGHLRSAGRALGDIVAAARGAGEMALCCGRFEGRNLARDFVEKLAALPNGAELLAIARRRAALASALDAPDTEYERLGGFADLEPGTLHVAALEVDTGLFRAEADASIGLEGHLAADGSVQLSPELGAILLAAAPALSGLADDDGAIHVPFQASGSWANLDLEIDVARLVARLDDRAPSGLFAFLRRAFWPSVSAASS